MNVYDFDNTIYDGDSTKDMVIYGLKKYLKQKKIIFFVRSVLN